MSFNYIVRKIGMKGNAPRLWVEGAVPAKAGFVAGTRFSANSKDGRLTLLVDPKGTNTVSFRARKGEQKDLFGSNSAEKNECTPIIDINSAKILDIFKGIEAVRLVLHKNRIDILPLATEVRRLERQERLKVSLQSGESIHTGSVSFGGGILSHALHNGLESAGIKTKLAFANDIREDLLDQAREHNDIWEDDTITCAAPMQELAFDSWAISHLPKVHILEMGLPCSGASVAGMAKRGLKVEGKAMPEAHPEVGHLVAAAVAILAQVNPSVVLIENVTNYANSASAFILKGYLKDFGYDVHETVLEGHEFNVLENRKRWCLVGVTKGIDFDFESLVKPEKIELRLGDIFEPVGDDASYWSEMSGLKAKEVRDKEAGKGFAMQIFTGEEKSVCTMTKGMAKNRSTDPKFQHPTNPNLLRVPLAVEHARCKGIPEHLVKGLSNTMAHELLGQSIVYPAFVAVGNLIGKSLKNFVAFGAKEFTSFSPSLAMVG